MKVLHVVEVSHGGVVSLARTFAEHQHADRIDVHVLAPEAAGEFAGTRHTWAPSRRDPVSLLAAARKLRRVVDRHRPDVVHLHSFFPGLLGRLHDLPDDAAVVYQPHSWAFQAARREGLARLVARWERAAVRRTDMTITNCTQELEEGRARGVAGRAAVVGLPLDTDRFRPSDPAAKAAARRELGLDDRRLLVCVGRLSRQKGQELLAEAWRESQLPDTVVALVGPGDPVPVAAAAGTTFGDTLRAVGPCDDVRPWLRAADLCVMPSRYEGQSVSMAEAMASGLPVVITDVNGAREAVAPADGPAAGAVVPVGAVDALLGESRARLEDPQRLAQEGAVARARAEELFRSQDVMARILDVYAAVAPWAHGRQREGSSWS
jgi:glycosyltransferase involved in cell wall biosynthesis